MDSPSPFGTLVRKWRKRAGLSAGQLAERLGCSRSYITAIERGKPPSIADHLTISQALNLSREESHIIALAWQLSRAQLCIHFGSLPLRHRFYALLFADKLRAGDIDLPTTPDFDRLEELLDGEGA